MENILNFSTSGNGFPLVFLHGFMGNKSMWNEYAFDLEKKYQVILIDLPGHGNSPVYQDIHSMDFMAKKVIEVLDYLSVSKAIFIGHSMGGYIIMSILKNYSDYIQKFCLFFSSPFEDDPVRKENRIRSIKIIEQNKDIFINFSVPNLFNKNNLENMKSEIELTKNQALTTSKEGIISAILGLKDRENTIKLFNETKIPCLLINGLFDEAISIHQIKTDLEFNEYKTHKVLPVGHCGHLEAKNECLTLIKDFIGK